MSLNNVRAVGDDRQWKDEVERELKSVLDIIKYGKITIRSAGAATGGGGGGAGAEVITATLPATYDNTTYVVGVDQDAFDRIGNLDYAQFNTATAATDAVGRMVWDANVGTLRLGLAGGNVEVHLGQAQYALVKNNTGTAFTKGQVVYPSGSVGASGVLEVSLAIATSDATSAQTFGVVAEPIANGAQGYVQTYGVMEDLNTAALTEAEIVYLSGTTAGGLTSTKPQAPVHLVYVGFCLRSQSSTGMIFIKPQNGYELNELHDVQITSATSGDILQRNASNLWVNRSLSTAGIATSASPTFTGTITTPLTTAGYVTTTAGGVLGSVATIPNVGLTNSSVTVAGQTVALGGSTGVSLDNLSDVVITTPASDQVIKYNGTNWVNAASPGGGGGTVTSITAGTGLSASPSSPITTSGTLNVTDAALNPPGAIIMFGSATPPSGWLLCNGQSTTGYTALAAIVGATVPDLRNRFIVGAGSTYAQGATGGATTHTHGLADGWAEIARRGNNVRMKLKTVTSWTATDEVNATSTGNAIAGTPATVLGGSTESGSSLPPYYALTYIIKT